VPRNSPPEIAIMMNECLFADADKRPTFEELDQRLKRVDVKAADPPADKTTISLFDIFPRKIAEALQQGKKVEPEHRDEVVSKTTNESVRHKIDFLT